MRGWAGLVSVVAMVACGGGGTSPSMGDAAAPRDAAVSDVAAMDRPTTACRVDRDCDDNIYCNGAEVCAGPGAPGVDARGCRVGPLPCPTGVSCSEMARSCSTGGCVDADRDGQRVRSATACPGDPLALDCDDSDPDRYTRTTGEICDGRNHDEDCNYITVGSMTDQDADNDTYFNEQCCNVITDGTTYTADQVTAMGNARVKLENPHLVCGADCDDHNPAVHPGAPEVCNGIDDNCEGHIDEGLLALVYRDCDGDGDGDENDPGVMGCADRLPVLCGFRAVQTHTDCDDRDPRRRRRGAVETCDGIDNNCNGVVDTDGAGLQCALLPPGTAPMVQACTDVVTCAGAVGSQTCDNTCHWGECVRTGGRVCTAGTLTSVACGNDVGGHNANCGQRRCTSACDLGLCEFATETCNERDDDCNGRIDEGHGHACDLTWTAGTGAGFGTDWSALGSAALDATTGQMVVANGIRGRGGAVFLRQPVRRALSMDLTSTVFLTRGETDTLGDGFTILMLTSPIAPLPDGTGGVPPGARGYAFSLIYTNSGGAMRIERLSSERTLIGRQDLTLVSPITGDTCAGAGNFLTIGTGTTTRAYRGGGQNVATITIRGRVITFSLTYPAHTGGCTSVTGVEPNDVFLGTPMYVGFGAATTDGQTMDVRVQQVELQRGGAENGGGACDDTVYCPR